LKSTAVIRERPATKVKRRMGISKGVLSHNHCRLRIALRIQSPAGIEILKARMVSVWAMGKKITSTHKQNKIKWSMYWITFCCSIVYPNVA
jgi:hypothetical protein